MFRDINHKKYEEQLSLLYPTLSDQEKEMIIENMLAFWEKVLDDIERGGNNF